MSTVELYHAPPSFYSQIARIALEEKGVKWVSKIAIPGPPSFETYEPWYMSLNPGGTVPTMVHDGHSVADSMLIARYVDEHFEGPSLTPTEEADRAEMERWLSMMKEVPIRALTYGSPHMQKVGGKVNGFRLARLRKNREKRPEMAEVYDAKIRDIESFRGEAKDDAFVDKTRARALEILDEMEEVLQKRTWLVGEQYTLADAIWTVGIGRFFMLKLAPLEGRPALAAWYARVKARPSFQTGDIWERMKPSKLIAAIAKKFWLNISLFLLVTTGTSVGIWWWLSS